VDQTPIYETGIDAASDREALDAPLSRVWTPPTNEYEEVVDERIASWNHIALWLRHIDRFRLG